MYGKNLTEKEFAQEVLGISGANYNRLRSRKVKANILKRTVIQLSVEEKNNIKKQLELKGYVKKAIDYAELQQLHQTYASQISEKDFATSVLEISARQYTHMKHDNNKAIILKSMVSQVSKEEINRIRTILIEKNYKNSVISYIQLQELHQTYGSQMPENIFAQEVLGMVYPTYIAFKNGRTKVTTILKDVDKISTTLDEIGKIKKQLQQQGYAGKSISYNELQKLHKMYGSQMSEYEFAKEILEITYAQYQIAKSGQGNAKVLKSLEVHISLEEIEKVKEQLKLDGYENISITYIQLQKLHQKYGSQMLESQFAQDVLGISYSSYGEIKSKRRNTAKILKSISTSSEEAQEIKQQLIFQQTQEEIKQTLMMQGYAGKMIDYSELQILHQTFGKQMIERDFALYILEITYGQYANIKSSKSKVAILENVSKLIEQEKIQEIKEILEAQGYVGKSIDYAELQILHKKYGSQMAESKFAYDVLEIIPSQYKRMKRGIRNAIILKSLIVKITQKEIDEIKQELEMQGYCEKKINYEELKMIHQKYGSQMTEHQFAQDVLGISGAFLGNMRRLPKAKARVLKSYTIPISEMEVETIKEILEEKGYGGKLIDYSELQRLHQLYCPQIREEFFAQVILEIPYASSYHKIKDGTSRTQILCSNMKTELIRDMLFKDIRWYTKEEIKQICLENGISLDKVIRQIASNGTNLYNENYKRVLDERGRLWIGKTRLSNEYVERNFKMIMKKAKIALKSVKGLYNVSYNSEDEDMIQNAVLWLIETAGEAEKNFIDYPDIMEQRIFNTLRRHIMLEVLSTRRIKVGTISLNQRLTPKQKRDKAKEGDELGTRIASDYNLENDALERIEEKETDEILNGEELATICIQEMKTQIEAGLSRQEVLTNIAVQFALSQEGLLEIMQNYLITNGKVKIDRGKAVWQTNLEDGR